MGSTGWVKIYRKIEDCPALISSKYDNAHAWIYLLLTANHKTQSVTFDGERIQVERGQMLTSVRKLSAKWGWSKDKVLYFLRSL